MGRAGGPVLAVTAEQRAVVEATGRAVYLALGNAPAHTSTVSRAARLAGHRQPPTGRPRGRPEGAQATQPRALRRTNFPAPT